MARRGGWRRVRSGKGFRYVDAHGDPIEDDEALERIRASRSHRLARRLDLPEPRAKLQAVGVDSAGRRQYRYSAAFRESQEREKYDRLIRFGERLPVLRERMSAHMALEPHARERVCAVAVRLIDLSWFRVGSERPARARRVYGVTTLTKRHVSVRGTRVTFRFATKNRTRVRDPRRRGARRRRSRPARTARRRARLPLPAERRPRPLTAPQLNEYVRDHLGPSSARRTSAPGAAPCRPRWRSPSTTSRAARRRRSA